MPRMLPRRPDCLPKAGLGSRGSGVPRRCRKQSRRHAGADLPETNSADARTPSGRSVERSLGNGPQVVTAHSSILTSRPGSLFDEGHLLGLVHDAIIATDIDGTVLSWNT